MKFIQLNRNNSLSAASEVKVENFNLNKPASLHLLKNLHQKFKSEINRITDFGKIISNEINSYDDHPVSFRHRTTGDYGYIEYSCPSDNFNSNLFFGSRCNAIVADFQSVLFSTLNNKLKAYENLFSVVEKMKIIEEENRNLTVKESILLPEIIFKPRSLKQPEEQITINSEKVSAGLSDLAIHCGTNGKALYFIGHRLYVLISNIQSVTEAVLWQKMLKYIASQCAFPSTNIGIQLQIDSFYTLYRLPAIMSELSEFVVSMLFDPYAIYKEWLQSGFNSDETGFAGTMRGAFGYLRKISTDFEVRLLLKIDSTWGKSFLNNINTSEKGWNSKEKSASLFDGLQVEYSAVNNQEQLASSRIGIQDFERMIDVMSLTAYPAGN